MAYLRALVAGLLAGFSLTAHAGYAQLAPPPGFSGGAGAFGYAAAANDQVFGRVIHQSGALTANVGGQAVKMPAAYRLAANAPRIAAAAVFAHPGVRTGVAIAAWIGLTPFVYDALNRTWKAVDSSAAQQSNGYEYEYRGEWYPTLTQACQAAWAWGSANLGPKEYMGDTSCVDGSPARVGWTIYNQYGAMSYGGSDLRRRGSACPAGWYVTPAGCVQQPPMKTVNEEEFINDLASKPMPDRVPLELPKPTVLPVEQPFINPEPGPNPAHRPLFVPTGNPVPNPKYDPNSPVGPANQPYFQPGVRVVPVPTPQSPFQVDMQPVDRPVASPDPNPDPVPDPEGGDGDKPKPDDQQSLCEKHPDIVACQRLGDVQPEALAAKTVSVSIQREDGFGPADGACPAPKEFVILGKQMAFRWDLICDFASGIRPLLVGFAYLSAALAFLGLSRKEV